MEAPFTIEQFFEVFKNYNDSVFPMQIFFFLMAIAAVYLTIRTTANSSRIISAILAFLWLWMGAVYHLVFFTQINKAAYVFGGIFILQGILFLYLGLIKCKLSFKLYFNFYGFTALALILYALIIYPLLGYFLGHVYPASPTFGLPCPSTIFTFAFLLLLDKKFPIAIVAIPFAWSIVGFVAAFDFGVFEDVGLLVAGLLSLPLLLIKNKKYKQQL